MPLRPQVPSDPPAHLPARLVDVWRAVHDVAAGTGRAALARQLGVSTHTLQSILVDGDVPDFRRASVRQVRSWTRTLCRVAARLGRDPRSWVEAAGIPWDDAAQAIARGAAGTSLPRPTPRAAANAGDAVEIGLAVPMCLPSLPDTEPPLLRLARRLVAALDPSHDVSVRHGPAACLLDDLGGDPRRPFLVVGILDSASLYARGVARLAIPGWQPELAALRVRAVEEPPGPRRWTDLARGAAHDPAPFVAQREEAAVSWLRAHWGVPAERVRAVDADAPAALADAVTRELRATPAKTATLLADVATCRAVHDVLRTLPHGGAMELLVAPEGEAPRFPLAIAMPAALPGWTDVVTAAWRDEIFGAARTATAALYAEILHAGCREAARLGGATAPAASDLARPYRPVHFPAADDGFQRVLLRELVGALLRERGLDEAAAARDPEQAASRWEELFALAHAVVPGEWRATLDLIGWAARRELFARAAIPLRPLHEHCRSCSQPLREYPGPSSSYCRFCADEEGHLRPRAEVLELIAEWMESWQGELPHERALERAASYMSAMPAWSEN